MLCPARSKEVSSQAESASSLLSSTFRGYPGCLAEGLTEI